MRVLLCQVFTSTALPIFIHNVPILALVLYDYFLTLAWEVQNIWNKQFRFPTLIFLLNRYLCLALCLALVCPTDTRAVSTIDSSPLDVY